MAGRQTLVVVETQKVKGYVFASPVLRETRGASLLLDRLNRIETQKLVAECGGDPVYLGGGAGRVLFASREQAESFKSRVLALYRQETWNARVSVEVVERQDGESFPLWMARGVAESQANKLGRVEAVPLLGGRWLRPCTSCGKEPAEHIPRPDVQGAHQLCLSCLQKREMVRAFYHDDKRNYDLELPTPRAAELREKWPDFVLTTLAETIERSPEPAPRTLLPRDFDDIGERSRPRNYFALIYADGNRMGETIRGMAALYPSDEEARPAYERFSAIVDRATREAAVEAVLAHVETAEQKTRDGEPGRFVPAEFVVAGGDDLILVVPAQSALPVASRFVTLFQEKSLRFQEEAVKDCRLACKFAPAGLTTSAGVVLAHASYPASQLVDMAAELMKIAKRKASSLAPVAAVGTVDFLVLHESGSEGVKRRRHAEYEGKLPSGKTVRYTERPYTAAEVEALCARIRALKESAVPRTKLKALYAVLFGDPVRAQFEALRIKERLKATGDLDRFGELRRLVDGLDRFPFREVAAGDWSTPLSELLEVYDFVPPKAAGGEPSRA
jgi:CRISPR RNA silencing complex Cmr2 subunit-like protein